MTTHDDPSAPEDERSHGVRRPDVTRLPELAGPAVDSLPGLARVAASAAWNTTEWGVKSSLRGWRRVGRALTQPSEAVALARDAVRTAEAVGEFARSVSAGTPAGTALMYVGESLGGLVERPERNGSSGSSESPVVRVESPTPEQSLRARGQELLSRSRDVWSTDQGHPAYDRILGDLAPDEARILLLLMRNGPQPSVDVRTGGPMGMMNSQLIAPGLTMIGPRAGVRYLDQVPAYLNNLFRLGLVWFSRESLRDQLVYQVVEAQPDVLAAMHSVKFPKVVRRSIHLTPFGDHFCRACLLEESEVKAEEFPEHAMPPEAGDAGPEPL